MMRIVFCTKTTRLAHGDFEEWISYIFSILRNSLATSSLWHCSWDYMMGNTSLVSISIVSDQYLLDLCPQEQKHHGDP